MAIYIINAGLVILFSASCSFVFKLGDKYKVSGKKVYAALVFIMFTCVMALRANTVGVDTAPYSRIFKMIGESGSLTDAIARTPLTAPVYVAMCWALCHISSDPQILTIISSLFVTIGLFVFLEKASDNQIISFNCWIGLTMFYAGLNGNRQFMALVLVINALFYLSENLLNKKGWILVILALGIHSVALFALIALVGVILVNKLKEVKVILVVSVVISLIFSFAFSYMVFYVVRFMPRYEMYIAGSSDYNILVGRGGGRIVFLYLFLLAIILLWIIGDRQVETRQDVFNLRMLPAVIFGTIFGVFNCRNELINRMLCFYIALFVTFIPFTVKSYHGIMRKVIMYGIIIALYVYSLISLVENQNGVVPYRFFWQ